MEIPAEKRLKCSKLVNHTQNQAVCREINKNRKKCGKV